MRATRTARRLTTLVLAVAAAGTALGAPPAVAATTSSGSCVDGGGTRWRVEASWGGTYTAADGTVHVAVDAARWTTAARALPTDSSVRTYDGAGGRLLQTLTWTGSFDYADGTAFRSRNPVNPASVAGPARVRVTLGVDGDGYGSCSVTLPQPEPASDRYERDVVTATNAERTSRSLVALAPQECVDRYAEAQAQRMADQSLMSHQELGPVVAACGLAAAGENVAYGYPDGAATTQAWMTSTGHRANLLNPRYREIGVGAAQDAHGTWFVAQVFGAR